MVPFSYYEFFAITIIYIEKNIILIFNDYLITQEITDKITKNHCSSILNKGEERTKQHGHC